MKSCFRWTSKFHHQASDCNNNSSNLKSVLDADDLLEVCVFDRKACEGSVDEGDDSNSRITQASVVQKYCY